MENQEIKFFTHNTSWHYIDTIIFIILKKNGHGKFILQIVICDTVQTTLFKLMFESDCRITSIYTLETWFM